MEKDNNKINELINIILNDYKQERDIDQIKKFGFPNQNVIANTLEKIKYVIYPGYYCDKANPKISISYDMLEALLKEISNNLKEQIAIVLACTQKNKIDSMAEEMTMEFLNKIPRIRASLDTDIDAIYKNDPAAHSKDEIIYAYPGLYAIFAHRLAHELYLLDLPILPRMISEHAHQLTGIDIHPGATIGDYFCIDHGTGIVIGETSVIGKYVTIYQNVTLGALSTKGGQKLKNVKRHPTICDNVTIYAGATILGGQTIIGENSTIGANAFIIESVPPNTKISIKN